MDSINSIAAMATDLKQTSTELQYSTSVAKKAKDVAELTGEMLVKMIQSIPKVNPEGIGENFDRTV